ncbi:type VI secretion system-associated protein TagF [uncultured Ruegeria sp.]|uniref:type VI secretion system-associated protein TagF n=1 Tax=uncultured Ruegeria sp. TaxID=259304 RepID=UPI00261703E5|nr:type VI secretion system-associated protein TagF [uncultured Ruegeria sp.]
MATGFFGKLPASGDFVARGLGPRIRPQLDRWLTLHLAQPARNPELWPETGLHALIEGPQLLLALVILPSHDAAGRHFPLAACCPVIAADQAGIEDWAAIMRPALHQAQTGALGPDALFAALKPTTPSAEVAEALTPPVIWGKDPPAAPEECLSCLFG